MKKISDFLPPNKTKMSFLFLFFCRCEDDVAKADWTRVFQEITDA